MAGDLTDAQGEAIQDLLPPPRRRGRPRADDGRDPQGYDSEGVQRRLRARGIRPCIPRRRKGDLGPYRGR